MVGLYRVRTARGIASGLMDPNSAMPAQNLRMGRKRADPAFPWKAWRYIHPAAVFFCHHERHRRHCLRRRFERALVRMRGQAMKET